jgi:D-glycerate 3-kinase
MIPASALDQVLQHYLRRIRSQTRQFPNRPFILAISGLQGSGKSTWAEALTEELNTTHGIKTINISLDDFYHNHQSLVTIKKSNSQNPLLRTRGQPGTHDIVLAKAFFASLDDHVSTDPVRIPSFDKSQFEGEGDRVPETNWRVVPREPRLEVVIFEGWCVGFQPIAEDAVARMWATAQNIDPSQTRLANDESTMSTCTLSQHRIDHLQQLNKSLQVYNEAFMGPEHFDGLLHLTTEELQNVYRWRLDQEHALITRTGSGMSDQEVIQFVQGYMPGYELYLEQLTNNPFFAGTGSAKTHVQVWLDRQRKVIGIREV